MKKIIPVILIFAVCLFFATGCGNPARTKADIPAEGSPAEGEPSEQGNNTNGKDTAADKKDRKEEIDLALKPNEAGKIMILMYHNIGEEEQEWVRTPDNFRKDMETLYEKGYRPISLTDYVNGSIFTEEGMTPVVITFDDGNLNNFEYLEDGRIKKDSVIGLLMDFHERHKDFPLEATFFVNGKRPFRQDSLIAAKLNFIIESGMDIGNHTKDHSGFKKAGAEEIQEQIGAEAQFLMNIISRDDYIVNTLALPFGERPKEESLTKYLASGSYQGVPYENIAVLNVGWNPAYSPYDKRFDQTSIPRIRASEMNVDNVGLYNYLDYFDKHPEERFISDGIAEIITVPAEKKEFVNGSADRELYLY